ncbi:hypothetical protein BXZ70DRAFT_278637 [Cristinia sonorae]|uniref:Uncharacterized protein n=1 Tax=Cristinia sonorae TaxID=1940300 RepID=A0A8K0UXA2_9AGAR|nr:hypothetical protein BXZ70DRAFT_278637 [Cristinia sonorae]
MDPHDPTTQLLASPSATTASSSASHASSPALNGVASSYLIGSSSLASALDSATVGRSRSGSSASPGLLTSASSELGFSSAGSGPPTSDPSLGFPPGYEQRGTLTAVTEDSDVPGGAHLLVLGDMLKKIARTANTGSEACASAMGPNPDARNLVDVVDVLKKNVLLVAELVAAMQLGDGSHPASSAPIPNLHAPLGSNPPVPSMPTSIEPSQLLNPPPPFTTAPNATTETISGDSSDMSRKRCASSVAADRVMKVMKMEPQDDVSLQTAPATLHAPPPSAPIPQFPFVTPTALAPSILEQASLPPSVPSSRPPSPYSLKHLQDSQGALHQVLQYRSIEPTQAIPHGSVDFTNTPLPPASQSFNPSSIPTAASSWPDPRAALQRHSLPGNSVLSNIPTQLGINVAGPSTIPSYSGSAVYSPTRPTLPPHSAMSSAPLIAGSHTTRLSRSSSISNPFAFNPGLDHSVAPSYEPVTMSRPPTSGQFSTRPSSPDYDNDGDREDDSDDGPGSSPPHGGHHHSPGHDEYGDENMEGIQSSHSQMTSNGQRRMSRTSPSAEGANSLSGHANEVPQEYRGEVERIFFEFLSKTCSNLDATDAKGEPIHQTLMAKKMQRLDESPDFRPFKFRIQAFTNAFLEELARQGYPEEKIPMKKIRNFLWNQPYISRFNEEGKKSKSKGNHIWHVDAKKQQDGGWVFRPFQRRLAGAPPGVAYVGLRWAWAPRIWDPQASRSNMPVTYTAPSLPSWLSWKDDVLSGIPPPDAQNCDVTVEARVGLIMFAAYYVVSDKAFRCQFMQDGQEEVLSHTVHVSIAPMAAVDASFTPSRRPSLVGDIHNPRRVMSDTALPQAPLSDCPYRPLRSQPQLNPSPPVPVTAPDSQVVQVLTTAAQRVAQEAQSQVVASPMDAGHELQALAKQQHVLTVTAQAFKSGSDNPEGSAVQSNALAAAAQQVVLQAARQIASDRTVAAAAAGSSPPSQQITVKEVSVATQSAVAQAVEMVGPLSSEVDVLMTAKSLLQQQTRAPPQTVDPSSISAPLDPVRPHSTGTLLGYAPGMAVQSHPGFYAHS